MNVWCGVHALCYVQVARNCGKQVDTYTRRARENSKDKNVYLFACLLFIKLQFPSAGNICETNQELKC